MNDIYIKTYVRKFGKDVIAEYKPPMELKKSRPADYKSIQAIYERKKEVVTRWINAYEYGNISYVEAMKKICEEV